MLVSVLAFVCLCTYADVSRLCLKDKGGKPILDNLLHVYAYIRTNVHT